LISDVENTCEGPKLIEEFSDLEVLDVECVSVGVCVHLFKLLLSGVGVTDDGDQEVEHDDEDDVLV